MGSISFPNGSPKDFLMDDIRFYYMVDLVDTVAGLIVLGVFLILRGRSKPNDKPPAVDQN